MPLLRLPSALILLVLAIAGGRVSAAAGPSAAQGLEIPSFRFEGNETVSDDELLSAIRSRETPGAIGKFFHSINEYLGRKNEYFDAAVFAEDMTKIRAALADRGFLQSTVDSLVEANPADSLLVKQEDLDQSVGNCWRCHNAIEFLKVPQWFIKSLEFKGQLLEMIDRIAWNPEFMKIRIQNWVNSLAWDWVVSRQRYFATAIPLWECDKCGNVLLAEEGECYVDPTSKSPRKRRCDKCGGTYVGATDVFDTWMDSSISTLYNTFWERDEKLFKKLYPMTMRPQGLEIIRTWIRPLSIAKGTTLGPNIVRRFFTTLPHNAKQPRH